jgi:hypothetical protein
VFLRVCSNNSELNQGGTDDPYAAFKDPKLMTAIEMCDVLNVASWVPITDESGDLILQKPSFEATDGEQEVSVTWGDPQDAASKKSLLGAIEIDADAAFMQDRYLGTLRKPVDAVPLGDSHGTLSIMLPQSGLPGSKLCVRVPDMRVLTIDVPLDATPGQTLHFIAPSAVGAGMSSLVSTGPGAFADGPTVRTEREPSQISFGKQTAALLSKSYRIQRRQRYTNCCQCCILIVFAFLSFSAFPRIPPPPKITVNANASHLTSLERHTGLHLVDVAEQLVVAVSNSTLRAPLPADHGFTADETIACVLFFSLLTTFHLPKLVHAVVEEKQQRLYHAMRLQGLYLSSYWASFWIWSMLIQATVSVPLFVAGYALKIPVFRELYWLDYIAILAVTAHSQAGLAAFGGCLFRSAKVATILFYLMIVGSVVAVSIINQILFLKEWSVPMLCFPLFSYERALTLMFMGNKAEAGQLEKAVLINFISGTALFAAGMLLHLIIPNEFGLTESAAGLVLP